MVHKTLTIKGLIVTRKTPHWSSKESSLYHFMRNSIQSCCCGTLALARGTQINRTASVDQGNIFTISQPRVHLQLLLLILQEARTWTASPTSETRRNCSVHQHIPKYCILGIESLYLSNMLYIPDIFQVGLTNPGKLLQIHPYYKLHGLMIYCNTASFISTTMHINICVLIEKKIL